MRGDADEADVDLKRRPDDLTMNAVVGVLLRGLEYFNGLLLLITHRVDDLDEAIVSRGIARIASSTGRERPAQDLAGDGGAVRP